MNKTKHFEYLVLGAGPAGIQLGYFFERDKRDYIIIEKGSYSGASFDKYPVHRKLISINKVYTGETEPEIILRHDWNSLLSDDYNLRFSDYDKDYYPSPDNMLAYLNHFTNHYQLKVQFGTQATLISRSPEGYRVTLDSGEIYTCRILIVGTGVGKPNIPDIPGIELVTQYKDVSTELESFADKSVLIIGKGNSGFETADHLIPAARLIHVCSPSPLKLAWKTHYVGNLRAVNNNFLDTYQLKSQNAVLDAQITNISKRDNKFAVTFNYIQAPGEVEEQQYDEVICCTGFKFDTRPFDSSCKPELAINDRFPSQTCEWESTNNENMFFVGTIMQMRDFKKANSGFIHGFRYNVRALNSILASRNHGLALVHESFSLDAKTMAKQILEHVNKSGALWQQTTFMCDYYLVKLEESEVEFYADIPKDYVLEKLAPEKGCYFVVTLAFGDVPEDPFDMRRPAGYETEKADQSNFLHPVIEQYVDGQVVSVHHVIENLFGEWQLHNEHLVPLEEHIELRLRSLEKVS